MSANKGIFCLLAWPLIAAAHGPWSTKRPAHAGPCQCSRADRLREGGAMPQRGRAQRGPGRSEGVQIRLDPALKQEARVYLVLAHMTWQDLLEPWVRQFVDAAHMPPARPSRQSAQEPPPQDLPPQEPGVQPALPFDLTRLLGSAHSLELLLGSATYRRWIHRCTRCERLWVAEKATPEKCVHCKSPYWHTPRTRRGAGTRPTRPPAAGEANSGLPTCP